MTGPLHTSTSAGSRDRSPSRLGVLSPWVALTLALALLTACEPTPPSAVPSPDPATYQRLTIAGDPGLTGVFDPSLVLAKEGDEGWMAYSSVDFSLDPRGNLVGAVSTAIAASSDGGASWRHLLTVNPAHPGIVTASDGELCGAPRCEGWMISEVPTLVEDPEDPDRERRFKLYAHRYFRYPPGEASGNALQRHLGGIALRTAPSPGGPWSSEQYVLGWDLSPPEISAVQNINGMGGDLAACLVVTEAGAVSFGADLDLIFACPFLEGGEIAMRIVLLRSSDHGASYRFVATLLEPSDAAPYGGTHFSAPEIARDGDRTLLFVTPERGEAYQGCVIFEFEDRVAGELRRGENGRPLPLEVLATLGGRFGGACGWDAGAPSVLMSQLMAEGEPVDPFRIFATGFRP